MTSATPPAATSTYYVAATNRLVSDWALYDNAGNMTAFKNPNGLSTGQWSAAYDGENKQRYYCGGTIATCGDANKTAEYVYDGEGNRVQKLTSSSTTTYVYDAFGRLAAEYNMGGPSEEAGTFYRTTDHLGSTRLVTDAAGDVVSRRDFFPFGEEIDANSSSGRNGIAEYNEAMGFPQLFTGKERDEESGLDYSLARYFASNQGRFTSPDAPFMDQLQDDPQSWNLYAYVRNRPLNQIDPSGRKCVDLDDGSKGDDGDGQGCAEAGVGPSEGREGRDKGVVQPDHIEVKESNPSFLETLFAPSVPRHVENDTPLEEDAQRTLTVAYYRTAHDLGCVGLGGIVSGASIAASSPIIPKRFAAGGVSSTSPASIVLGGLNVGTSVPTPVGMPGTSSFAWRASSNAGRIAGRYLPYVGTVVGAAATYRCLGSN